MTDKEVRLELAKAALIGGASMERMKNMYVWVTGDATQSSMDFDSIKVTELEQYLGMSAVRFRNRCMENDIHSVGQLVRIGARNFRALKLVGGGLVMKVKTILSEHYNVDDW